MNRIAIFGVPRSGTTWLSQIFNSHPDVALRFQPLFSYGHKGRLDEHSSAKDISSFFDEILHSTDAFSLMTSEMQKDYPRFQKSSHPTHIAFKETRYLNIVENLLRECSDIKIIGIVRNPLAVLASWIKAPREFDCRWKVSEQWRNAPAKNMGRPEEFYGFEKWKLAASSFLKYRKDFSENFRLVSYAELNSFPLRTTQELFQFCGLPRHTQVERFIADSRSRHDEDPYSVFRGKASDRIWREVLQDDIAGKIVAELVATPLGVFLEDFEDA